MWSDPRSAVNILSCKKVSPRTEKAPSVGEGVQLGLEALWGTNAMQEKEHLPAKSLTGTLLQGHEGLESNLFDF